MRLLVISTASIHLEHFLDLIKGQDFEVVTISDGTPPPSSVSHEKLVFSLRNPIGSIRSIRRISHLASSFRPDLVHVHQAGTHAWLTLKALRQTGIPVVVSAWGSDILLSPQKGILYRKMVRYILRKGRYFTSDSIYMASRMKALAGHDLDVTILNWSVEDIYRPGGKEQIVYSNRLHKDIYRIDEVIRAFHRFTGSTPQGSWTLVIAGEGPLTPALKNLADELGLSDHVSFVGWLSSGVNQDYYRRARIFVSLPISDATSVSLLEALSAGCIPVVSDLPANMEWVMHRINGIIAHDLKADILGEAMQLDTDQALRINRELFRTRASREASLAGLLSLYRRILPS